MKYKRNQYSEGLSVCSFIIAGILIYWGLNDLFIRPILYSSVISWFGIVWLIIGIAIVGGQVGAWANRSKLRNTVLYEYEEHPEATIEEISRGTGISVRDIRAIVLDLKAGGQLRGKFSSTTGQMTHVEVKTKTQTEVPPSEGKVSYCPNCGTAKSKDSAVYCSYCGSKL
ncbi:MAG: zinc ribbon domain-containing protein [Promethearchaeota archaeon]|jgi:hypothetical protein